MPFEIENRILKSYTPKRGEKNIIIPDGVIRIENRVFSRRESLTSIIIPESVTSIGESAFSSCKNLSSMFIPNSVSVIGNKAFNNCIKLNEISVPIHLSDLKEKRSIYALPDETRIIIREETIPMVKNHLKNPEAKELPEKTELEMIFEYFKMSEDKDARIYIQNHLAEFMQFLIDKQNVERITEITEHTDFLTADNIDEFLKYSIQNSENGGSFKIQLILTNYKAKLLNL